LCIRFLAGPSETIGKYKQHMLNFNNTKQAQVFDNSGNFGYGMAIIGAIIREWI
jgi:hypothetical protein